jgi:hypothetical protein
VTFNLVSFAWVFFRAMNLKDATYVIFNMLTGVNGLRSFLGTQGMLGLVITTVAVLYYVIFSSKIIRHNGIEDLIRKSCFYRYLIYNTLILMILFLAKYSATKTFIYFQF